MFLWIENGDSLQDVESIVATVDNNTAGLESKSFKIANLYLDTQDQFSLETNYTDRFKGEQRRFVGDRYKLWQL